MSFHKKLILKIKNKNATIAIIGLGYVGLPLSVEIAKKGFKVTIILIRKIIIMVDHDV